MRLCFWLKILQHQLLIDCENGWCYQRYCQRIRTSGNIVLATNKPLDNHHHSAPKEPYFHCKAGNMMLSMVVMLMQGDRCLLHACLSCDGGGGDVREPHNTPDYSHSQLGETGTFCLNNGHTTMFQFQPSIDERLSKDEVEDKMKNILHQAPTQTSRQAVRVNY